MSDPEHYLRRAHNRLHEAEVLMAGDVPAEGVVNRLYYAAREAALAVLAHLDTEPMPRTHSGLRAVFYREVVEKGLMDQDWSRELANLERHRIQADYGHVTE